VPDDEPYLSALSRGVHAYVQPDGGWCLNNAGFVSDGGETLLVDTAATERRTLLLRDALLSTGAPLPSTLVNTHHHGDHTYGNSVFAGNADILAHSAARAEQLAAGHQLHQIWPDTDFGHVPVTPPTSTYEDTLTLHVGGIEVRLIHPGPAHTTGDTVVWLPRQRTVFAGDLIFNGGTPFVMAGSVSGSLRALDLLRELDAETVVPGHGPVCGPESYDVTERYLRYVAELAAEGRSAGATPLETARSAGLGEFAELREPERLVPNLHRAYAELDSLPPGTQLDLIPVLADMAAMNGGQIPACHA
jgi:cyclase